VAKDILGNERVRLSEVDEHALQVWTGVAGLVWCAIYGLFSFVRDTRVPVLWLMQLAVHETGHRVFAPFGEYVMVLMGSGSEILAPFLLGLALLLWKRKAIAAGVCWAVAAAACEGTSIYIADAPVGRLTLIGGDESDWLRILDDYWDKLYKADVYAARVRTAGIVLWILAVGLVVLGTWHHHRKARMPGPGAKPVRALAPVSPEEMWRSIPQALPIHAIASPPTEISPRSSPLDASSTDTPDADDT
jgi:hypothetical protein